MTAIVSIICCAVLGALVVLGLFPPLATMLVQLCLIGLVAVAIIYR